MSVRPNFSRNISLFGTASWPLNSEISDGSLPDKLEAAEYHLGYLKGRFG
jgi:hypothetical protein